MEEHTKHPERGYDALLKKIPVPGIAGAHLRPLCENEREGSGQFYGIWTYDNDAIYKTPVYPPHDPPLYATVVLRGLSRMIPALSKYFSSSPSNPTATTATSPSFLADPNIVSVDSGYYCKTVDNTPLIGPVERAQLDLKPAGDKASSVVGEVEVKGLFVNGGVSGFGVMCSQAAGELAALHVLEYLLDPSSKSKSSKLTLSSGPGSDLVGEVEEKRDERIVEAVIPYAKDFLPGRMDGLEDQGILDGPMRGANQL
ncbi:hypothetical protein HK102_006410 [Quaeritorhiza haematococci]|nr:hypothetical protein HK102_006410 [Quaeritorhiza haematococci]